MAEENEIKTYTIPLNYKKSPLRIRKIAEAVILSGLIALPLYFSTLILPIKITTITVFGGGIAIWALTGMGGDSLGMYLANRYRYRQTRKELVYDRRLKNVKEIAESTKAVSARKKKTQRS